MKQPSSPAGRVLVRTTLFVLYTALLYGVCFGVIWLRCGALERRFSDTMFFIGLISLCVGVAMCMKGSPVLTGSFQGRSVTGIESSAISMQQSNSLPTDVDRGSPSFFKHFAQNNVVEVRLWRLVPVAAGAGMIVTAILVCPPV